PPPSRDEGAHVLLGRDLLHRPVRWPVQLGLDRRVPACRRLLVSRASFLVERARVPAGWHDVGRRGRLGSGVLCHRLLRVLGRGGEVLTCLTSMTRSTWTSPPMSSSQLRCCPCPRSVSLSFCTACTSPIAFSGRSRSGTDLDASRGH